MASFPDLRPRACLATAKCRAALSFGPLASLLTARAVLRAIAFVAVSELATLRGNKALKTSAFPARTLWSPATLLVGAPAFETRPA
jgi:hypothetical protein